MHTRKVFDSVPVNIISGKCSVCGKEFMRLWFVSINEQDIPIWKCYECCEVELKLRKDTELPVYLL
jgi:hypothetical protein